MAPSQATHTLDSHTARLHRLDGAQDGAPTVAAAAAAVCLYEGRLSFSTFMFWTYRGSTYKRGDGHTALVQAPAEVEEAEQRASRAEQRATSKVRKMSNWPNFWANLTRL